MKKIGLTGGIGSGKSTVSKLFEVMGFPVYSADAKSKRLTDTSPYIRAQLTAKFGADLYKNDILNKPMLASLIFGNEENLHFVNSVIHPAVFEDFRLWVEKRRNFPLLIAESAILFESGFSRSVDFKVNVSASLETRINRVEKRDLLSRGEILDRIHNQLPDEERNRLSDHIIYNEKTQALLPQVENLIKMLELQIFE